MSLAIVGLSIGLFVSCGKDRPSNTVNGLEIMIDDDHLINITTSESELPTYSIDLNSYDTFRLKYVAKPTDLKEYYITVSSSDNLTITTAGTALLGEQSGEVDFKVNGMPSDNLPIKITFRALNKSDSEEAISVASVNILVTKPSSLKSVNNIKYDGEYVTWDAVISDVNNNPIVSNAVKYLVKLKYTDSETGEERNQSIETAAGETKFKLSTLPHGFETGVINEISVVAKGDGTVTADSVESAVYKFYILKTPTISYLDEKVIVDNVDDKAAATVVLKKVGDVITTDYLDSNVAYNRILSNLARGDKYFDLAICATIKGSAAVYDHNTLNYYIDSDGVNVFDSFDSEYTNVQYLLTSTLSASNDGKSTRLISGQEIELFDNTILSWTHSTNDIATRKNIRYLLTITSNATDKSVEVVLGYGDFGGVDKLPAYRITNELLNSLRSTIDNKTTYSITVAAFLPMSDTDKGEIQNAAINGVHIVDNKPSTPIRLDEYIPNINNFAINVDNNGILSYIIPSASATEQNISAIDMVFVSNNGDIKSYEVSESGTINLKENLIAGGTYNLYIYIKATDGSINIIDGALTKDNVYRTLGVVTNPKLSIDGMLKFDAVDGADNYKITVNIGGASANTIVSNSNEFDIINFVKNNIMDYAAVPSNDQVTFDPYTITIETMSDTAGVFGAATSINWRKFSTVGSISEQNTKIIDIDSNSKTLQWGRVDGAIAYKLIINNDAEKSIIVNNSETTYRYAGQPLESWLQTGSNTISIIALGKEVNGETILYSNIVSASIDKLATPTDIKVLNNKLYFNGSNAGKYNIAIKNNGVIINNGNIQYTNVDNSENVLDLTDYTINANQTYTIEINQIADGKFDSDYSAQLYISKIANVSIGMAIISDKYHIVWAKDTMGLRYASNTSLPTSLATQEIDGVEYYILPISDININDSIGLNSVGDYIFSLKADSEIEYVLANNSATNLAYISSEPSTINIHRLDKPVLSIGGKVISISTSDTAANKYDITVEDSSSSIIYDMTHSLINIATIDMSQQISSAGNYVATAKMLGNVDSSIAFGKNIYYLDSDVSTKNITKLNSVTLSIIANANNYQLRFDMVDNQTYALWKKSNNSTEFVKTNVDISSGIINLSNTDNCQYYVVASRVEEEMVGYLDSNPSNTISVANNNMASNALEFASDNVVSWDEVMSDGKIASSSYILTVLDGEVSKAQLIINLTNDGIDWSRKYYVVGNESDVFTITASGDIAYVDGKYYFDINYFINNGVITAGDTSYYIRLQSIGRIDDSTIINPISATSTLQFNYYNTSDIVSATSDKILQLSNPAKADYVRYYIDITKSGEIDPSITGVIELSNGRITIISGDISVSRKSNGISINTNNLSAGEYTLDMMCNRTNGLGVPSKAMQFNFSKVAEFGDSGEGFAIRNGELFLTNAVFGKNYQLYYSDSRYITITNESTSVADIKVNTSLFGDSVAAYVIVEETDKLSSDVSNIYNINRLAIIPASNISTHLIYEEDNITLSQFQLIWSASNMANDIDLASSYTINVSNGEQNKIYTITANTTNGNCVYDNGTYTLTLSTDIFTSFDLSKGVKIIIQQVIGDVDKVVSDVGYISSKESTYASTINFLSSPSAEHIQVIEGKLVIKAYSGNYNKAYFAIYNAINNTRVFPVDAEQSYLPNELSSGLTLDMDGKIVEGTYYAVIKYIGNNSDIVSTMYRSSNIVKSNVPDTSVTVENGELKILCDADTTYTYAIMSKGEVVASDTVTTDTTIDTTNLIEGASKIVVKAYRSGELYSEEHIFDINKLYKITTLTKELQTDGGLKLIFDAKNIVNNTDKAKYSINFVDRKNVTTIPALIVDPSNLDSAIGEITLTNDYYTLVLTKEYMNNFVFLQNVLDIDITITSIGTDYISNMSVTSSNSAVINKYGVSTKVAEVTDGCFVVTAYTFDVKPDIVKLTFGNKYQYIISDYNGLRKVIDFSIVEVTDLDTDEQVILPSGEYSVVLEYISRDNTVYSNKATILSVVKTAPNNNCVINNNYNGIVWSPITDNGKTYTYIYTLEKPDGSTLEVSEFSEQYKIDLSGSTLMGEYTLTLQPLRQDSLKGDATTYTFLKLAMPNEITANINEDGSKLNIQFAVPDNNVNGDVDRASQYAITIGEKQYNIVTNYLTIDNSYTYTYTANGDNTCAISVTYDTISHTYNISQNIDRIAIFEEVSGYNSIVSSNAGKVVVGGVDNTPDELVIELTSVIGSRDVLSASGNSISTSVSKIQTDKYNVTTNNGLVVINDNGTSSVKTTKVSFYKKYAENQFAITPDYVTEINGKANNYEIDLADISENITTGTYLVVTEFIANYSDNIIDGNAVINKYVTVTDTPKLYINNGELCWTGDARDQYYITYTNSKGDSNQFNTTETTFNTNNYVFEAGEYRFQIRSYKQNELYSKISDEFTVIKLPNPTIINVSDVNNSALSVVDRTIRLIWKGVDNATGYVVYDYCDGNIKTSVASEIEYDDSNNLYSYEIDRDTIGEHKYYVIALGTSSTYIEGTYQSSGYVNSYNNFDNMSTTEIVSAELITNITSKIFMNNGVINWDIVEFADYYDISITAYTQTEDSYILPTISTSNNQLDLTTITNEYLDIANKVVVSIEAKTTGNQYISIIGGDLPNITVYKHISDDAYQIQVIDGMMRYIISRDYYDQVILLVGARNAENGDLINTFLHPMIKIDNVEYVLGEGIKYAGAALLLDRSYNLIDYVNVSDLDLDTAFGTADYIILSIVLPSSYAAGTHSVAMRTIGNSTTNNTELAISNNTYSNASEVYKITTAKSIDIQSDYDAQNKLKAGILRFAAPVLDNINAKVLGYKLRFTPKNNAKLPTQEVTINITSNTYSDPSQMYAAGFGGYIDNNNFVYIDIYTLFVINNTGLYNEFEKLQTNQNYDIDIVCLGGEVYTDNGVNKIINRYLDSNYSSIKSTFKVLTAPKVTVADNEIRWNISKDVSSFTIYFYDKNNNQIYKDDNLQYEPGNAQFRYTNIRDNEELPAGVYNIKVVANGNNEDILTSNLGDCDNYYAQKLDNVAVTVDNGLFKWTNPKLLITDYNGTEAEEDTYYRNYIVDIYLGDNKVGSKQVASSDGEYFVYELGEEYASANENNKYHIIVYPYTSISNCLLPSDTSIGQEGRSRSEIEDINNRHFVIDTYGDITWNDKYNNQNNYIAYISNQDGQILFKSALLYSPRFNIYNLYDDNGQVFNAEAGFYNIKIKSINKTLHSDKIYSVDGVDTRDAILRSVYSYNFDIRLINQPNFTLYEGELDWDTTTSSIGYEITKASVRISGKFISSDGTEVNSTVYLEFDRNVAHYSLIEMRDLYITRSIGGDIIRYSNVDNNTTDTITLNMIEGESYEIDITFIGDDNITVMSKRKEDDLGNTFDYLISSRTSTRFTNLLNNPAAPVNPSLYGASEDTSELDIYNNIPNLGYSNYIYWNTTAVGTKVIEDYDVEIYARDKDNATNTLLYQYRLRNILGVEDIQLVDVVNNTIVDTTDLILYGMYSVNKGVYLGIDKVLTLIVSDNIIDFSTTDICIYVEAVGDTDTTFDSSVVYNNNVTYHYFEEYKLDNANTMVLPISLPTAPTNLEYNGLGKITWAMTAGSEAAAYPELVVVYKVNSGKTVETAGYNNIKRIQLDNSTNNNVEYRLRLANIMGIDYSDESWNELFNFDDTSTCYYIDTITLTQGTEWYKLRYYTDNIVAIAARSVGFLTDSTGTIDFVSTATKLLGADMANRSFTLFDGGDGTKNNPFKISNSYITRIEHYLTDNCYFDVTEGGFITTVNSMICSGNNVFDDNDTFNGNINFNNNTINISSPNMEVTSSDGRRGFALFYKIGENSTITNLNISVSNDIGVTVNASDVNSIMFGLLAIHNEGIISNVRVTSSNNAIISVSYGGQGGSGTTLLGGLVANNSGIIAYCDVAIDLTINSNSISNRLGGIAAINSGEIIASAYTGALSGKTYMGGVAGYSTGNISYAYTRIEIIHPEDSNRRYIGGIAGLIATSNDTSTSLNHCYAIVEGVNNYNNALQSIIGGLVGSIEINGTGYSVKISNSYASLPNSTNYGNALYGSVMGSPQTGSGISYENISFNGDTVNKAFGSNPASSITGITAVTGNQPTIEDIRGAANSNEISISAIERTENNQVIDVTFSWDNGIVSIIKTPRN